MSTSDASPQLLLDLEYAEPGVVAQRLDAALPPGAGPFPGVILLHGGGWAEGDKAGYHHAFPPYLERGIACFSVEYRLSGEATYPAAEEDCLAAVRWIRAHAAELRLDPDRLAVVGSSAGAHLSLLLATTPATEADRDSTGARLPHLVRAVASCAGPTDLVALATPGVAPESAHYVMDFMGGTPEELPAAYAAASPLTRVTADMPPVLLVQGTTDHLVPLAQATAMEAKMRSAGTPVELWVLEGVGHEAAGAATDPRVVDFLASHLR